MCGDEQDITQNFTIKVYFDSLEELEEFAAKYSGEIKGFVTSKAQAKYNYHFVEFLGPNKICKIEASFSENL